MSTSFSYVLFPHHRRRDGTLAVSIRMIHNRKARYHASSIVVTREQMTKRMDRITDVRVLERVNAMLDEYRRIVSEISGADWMTADEVWRAVEARLRMGHVFRLDVFDYADGMMRGMEPKTAEGYRSALNMLERFIGRRRLDVNEITRQFVMRFRSFIERETSVGSRATSYYLSCLRHIHNKARDEFNDEDGGVVNIPRRPFTGAVIPPQPVTRHRALSVGQMKEIAACTPATARGCLARDVFLLSFCLIGMNTADMYDVTATNITGGVLTYNRRKTDSVRRDNAVMSVRLEPEAESLMERLKGRRQLLLFRERYADHRAFNNNINKGLKEIGGIIGVEGLTTYHARHTWATLARNVCGVDFDTVSRALNHATRGTDKVTDIYVDRDWSKVWDANKRVLDAVFGK